MTTPYNPIYLPPAQGGQQYGIPPYAAPNHLASAPGGLRYFGTSHSGTIDPDYDEIEEVQRCHLHSKPQLNCKFCRKYKSAVHQMGRMAQVRQAQRPTDERRNLVEMTDASTYNVNNLLRGNILSSEYFKSLFSLKTFTEVVDEIYQYTEHAEPYVAGSSRAPSTLFCCLYKFFTMRLTEKQMHSLLDHPDSPYIRCAGFLYLRYVHPPEKLWYWYEPYFLDDDEFTPGSDKQRTVTMGEYVESLITEDKYFNTILPRLPVKYKNLYGAQLIALDEHRRRKKENKKRLDEFEPGARVCACSNGDWLNGEVVDIDDFFPGRMQVVVKLEDESEERIDIGLVLLRKSKHSSHYKDKKRKKKQRRSLSGENSQFHSSSKHASTERFRDMDGTSQTQQELLEEFRRREREKALATGKDYARRPTSYKSSLSLRLATGSTRKRSRSHSPNRATYVTSTRASELTATTNSGRPKEISSEYKHRIAQLMEKYHSKGSGSSSTYSGDQEGPEVMRLG